MNIAVHDYAINKHLKSILNSFLYVLVSSDTSKTSKILFQKSSFHMDSVGKNVSQRLRHQFHLVFNSSKGMAKSNIHS